MTSIKTERASGGNLEDVSNMLGLVGGGGEPPRTSSTPPGSYITPAMLEETKKQLEDTHAEAMAHVTRELVKEREERKENEERLKNCIQKLMDEVRLLSGKVTGMQERIGEVEKSRGKFTFTFTPEPRNVAGSPSDSGVEASPVATPANLEDAVVPEFVSNGVTGDILSETVAGRGSLTEVGDNPGGLGPITETVGAGGRNYLFSRSSSASQVVSVPGQVETGSMVITHQRENGSGRFLPFLCRCGLEFDSATGLSEHVGETSEPIGQGAEEPANNSDPSRQLPSSSSTVEATASNSTDTPVQDHQVPSSSSSSSASISNNIDQVNSPPPQNETDQVADADACHGADPSRPLYCICRRRFTSDARLSQHIRTTTKGLNSCKSSGSSFQSTYKLRRRLKPAHPTTSKSLGRSLLKAAPKPMKLAVRRTSLTRGPRQSSNNGHGVGKRSLDKDGIPRFYCKCQKSFGTRQGMKYHIIKLSMERNISCGMCSSRFYFGFEMNNHMARVHNAKAHGNDKISTVICSGCGESFQNLSMLQAHRSAVHKRSGKKLRKMI